MVVMVRKREGEEKPLEMAARGVRWGLALALKMKLAMRESQKGEMGQYDSWASREARREKRRAEVER